MILPRRQLKALALTLLVGCAAPSTPPTETPTQVLATPSTTTVPTVDRYQSSPETTIPQPEIPVAGPGQALIAHPGGEIEVFPFPSSGEGKLMPAATILGTPAVYLVEGLPSSGWVRLALPGRPNGSTGWALASQLQFHLVSQLIKVDLTERSLTFFEEGEELLTATVAIGSATNPTPTGRFYVTDIVELADPASAWGPFAVGISARSETITEFNGGDGIIGIHGTNRPATIGEAVSLGCIRLDNNTITELAAMLHLGTPVVIEE